MNQLELENFLLIEYDANNKRHQDVIATINSTENGKKYLGNLYYTIQRIYQRRESNSFNIPYIVYYLDEPMGYISLSYIDNSYQISYGIIPKYQGQYLGSELLMEFSDILFEMYPNIDKLSLKISNDNIGSIKLATKVGYVLEDKDTYTQKRM